MRIAELELKNFRKFKEFKFEFQPGINLVTGLNGSGKSTLLDSIGFAIYGELTNGTNLRDNLRYGQRGRSKSGFVKLSMTNSNDFQIKRELRMEENVASQTTLCNGKIVNVLDISKIQEMLPQKDVFFEIVFIDNIRQELHDVFQKDFWKILSTKLLPWNLQNVIYNTNLASRRFNDEEDALKRKLLLLREYPNRIESLESSIISLNNRYQEISQYVEKIKKTKEDLMKTKISGEKYEKHSIQSIDAMERNFKQIESFVDKLKRDRCLYVNILKEKIVDDSVLNKYLKNYIDNVDFLSSHIQETSRILRDIISIQRESHLKRKNAEKELIIKMNEENRKLSFSLAELEIVSNEIKISKKQLEECKFKEKLLVQCKREAEKIENCIQITQRLKNLIDLIWNKTTLSFFKKIEKRVNEQLSLLEVDLFLSINNEKIVANIGGIKTDSALFSAGETGLLNILVRIAILQELGQTSLLILEDPIAHFDELRTKRFLSMLTTLKDSFTQIILTSNRIDLKIEVDNQIFLTN